MINVMLNVIVASFIALAILVPAKNYFTIMVILFGIYFILDYFYKQLNINMLYFLAFLSVGL